MLGGARPILFDFASAPAPTWTLVAVGLCVTMIATMQLWADRKARTPSSTRSIVSR